MILNRERYHYIALKKSILLRGITSDSDFYCINCLRLIRTKKLESDKKVSKIKIFFVL